MLILDELDELQGSSRQSHSYLEFTDLGLLFQHSYLYPGFGILTYEHADPSHSHQLIWHSLSHPRTHHNTEMPDSGNTAYLQLCYTGTTTFFLNLCKFTGPSEVLQGSYGTGMGICEFTVVWHESGKREILNGELSFTEHKSIAVFFN